ncbi:hypothetical protein E1742_11360 [Pseudoduganella plicata]|uniref:Barstar (barnase inhibitor) domain-containing protein n=2 Tax=Pseudoduganella plicata TaxID=321984 RepID=A0ABX5SIG9_9BURK|nr:hypothetical protein E1742_11360 [Pseudoduganella plicata]
MPRVNGPGEFVGFVKSGVSSVDDLFAELDRALAFPWYFGGNWNAVSDCLRDFQWRQETEIALVHQDVPGIANDELVLYLEILIYCILDWKKMEPAALPYFPRPAQKRYCARSASLPRCICQTLYLVDTDENAQINVRLLLLPDLA